MENPHPTPLSRRRFIGGVKTVLLSGILINLTGCLEIFGTDTLPGAHRLGPGDKEGIVQDNHLHQAIITDTELKAGGAVVLHIIGQSEHDHTVEISAEDVEEIRAGRRVSRKSSVDNGHYHLVWFN